MVAARMALVAINRHPGQVGYSHNPPQEGRDEESSLRGNPGEEVKAGLRMPEHAKRLSGSVSQTCRFFGVSRALYYIWKKR